MVLSKLISGGSAARKSDGIFAQTTQEMKGISVLDRTEMKYTAGRGGLIKGYRSVLNYLSGLEWWQRGGSDCDLRSVVRQCRFWAWVAIRTAAPLSQSLKPL